MNKEDTHNVKKIIGIDPGLIHTGWGLITVEGNLIKHIDHGLIKVKTGQDLSDRLYDIHRDLSLVLNNFLPDEAALEQTFVNNNALSSLKLGHARGAIMLSLSMMNIKCYEYAPNQIKKVSLEKVMQIKIRLLIWLISCSQKKLMVPLMFRMR